MTNLFLQGQAHVQSDQLVLEDNDVLNLEVLLQFIKKFWGQLEIPDLESRDTGEIIDEDDKISKIDNLIKFCLSFDPNDSKFRKIR